MYNHRNEEKWLVPMHTYIYTYIIVIRYYTIQLNFCTFSLYMLNKSDEKTHSCYSPPSIFVYSLKLFSVRMKTSKSYRLQDFLLFEGAPRYNLSNALCNLWNIGTDLSVFPLLTLITVTVYICNLENHISCSRILNKATLFFPYFWFNSAVSSTH